MNKLNLVKESDMTSDYSLISLGYDETRFQTQVNNNFCCGICDNVMKDPVMCRNQHGFCRGCITIHLRKNSQTCPICRDELTAETLTEAPRIVKNYLNEQSIRCKYFDRGCQDIVQLERLEGHVAECGFAPVVCGNEGCGETINKRDRRYHEGELCQYRKLICVNFEELTAMMADMKTKMADLDTKVGVVNAKLEKVDTRLANTDTKTACTQFENADTKLANLDTKVDVMGTKLEVMGTNVENLQQNVNAKFGQMNNDMERMRTNLNEVKEGFDNFKEAVIEKKERKDNAEVDGANDVDDQANGERRILVAGGFGCDSVEMFNYSRRLWSTLKPMTRDREGASSFVYNNQATVAGGSDEEGAMDSMISIGIHPIPDASIDWGHVVAKLPTGMHAQSSVVYNDSLFVIGGYDSDQGNVSNRIYEIMLEPPHRVEQVSTMPEPRVYHGTELCDGSIYIFGGGKSGRCRDNMNSVLSYDIETTEAQRLPALPYQVGRMATVKWGENAVIIGGVDRNGRSLNSVVIYNMKTGKFYMLPPMLRKRDGCTAVVIENTIVVLGGDDEAGNTLKSVEGFNFGSYSWEELPDMNEARMLATAVVF
ncbi:uncharacterized protein LOC114524016 [Dendronephthya gigantea]|uniref:uncharacterized protein LOC114524016 n=1 Tax=Dendronephthya gigantea TaxID=151771 RepID=UPI00106A6A1B|nr:uncharacterized protein LOC114524016 [Dendronephthya gigantea]